jgi:hypothetical protein
LPLDSVKVTVQVEVTSVFEDEVEDVVLEDEVEDVVLEDEVEDVVLEDEVEDVVDEDVEDVVLEEVVLDDVVEEVMLVDDVLEEVVVVLVAKVAAWIASPMTMNPLPMGVPKGTTWPVKVFAGSVHSA